MMYISSAKERCVQLATHLIETRSTVRAVAAKFGVSKSTVHKDITTNLKRVNPELYQRAKEMLEINKKERHLRGGEATRKKFIENKYKNRGA